MSVERSATIRLAIEWAQSQLTLPNLDGLVASQKAAAAASREATTAMQSESSAAATLSAESNQLSAMLHRERQAAIDVAGANEVSTRNTLALARSSGQLERGLSGMVRGLAFAAVACGDLDAKSLGLLIGIEGLTQVARSAGMVWRGYTAFVLAAEAAEVSLAVATAALAVEYAPIIAAGAVLVFIAYELEQAWTAEARAEKAAADQMKTNLDQEKKDAELSIQVWERWGAVQREGRQDVIRGLDQYMTALRKSHQEEEALTNAAASEFNMKPGERMRLNRDRATLAAGGTISDRELRFDIGHTFGDERDSFSRMAQKRLQDQGGPAHFSDGRNEAYKTSIEGAERAKTTTEDTARSIDRLVTTVINNIKVRLEEAERQLGQQKHAAIARQATGGSSDGAAWIGTSTVPIN